MSDSADNMIQEIQGDLPLTRRPFQEFARHLGVTETELCGKINALKEHGLIRRYGAVLRHRDAGFQYNVMAVFNVPDGLVDDIGERLAAKSYISHCYERDRCDDWPYNLYAMIHARDEGEGESFMKECQTIVGNFPCNILKSLKEYKKTSLTILKGNND